MAHKRYEKQVAEQYRPVRHVNLPVLVGKCIRSLLELSHLEGSPLEVILYSAWSSNHNVNPSTQSALLRLVGTASIHT